MSQLSQVELIAILVVAWILFSAILVASTCMLSSKFTKERKEKGLEDKYYEDD